MNVAIVKYNAGNIYSVVNALRRMGIEPMLTDDHELLRKADRVLFPGQGEARGAMEYLKARRLDEVIRDLKQPVFGICVGQQLLCSHSEEGDVDCIGIFDAEVKRFQPERHEDPAVQPVRPESVHKARTAVDDAVDGHDRPERVGGDYALLQHPRLGHGQVLPRQVEERIRDHAAEDEPPLRLPKCCFVFHRA